MSYVGLDQAPVEPSSADTCGINRSHVSTFVYCCHSYTTKVVSLIPVHGKVYTMQHYVIKFVSDLRQISGFLRVLWFPPPIELTVTI